VTEPDVAPDRPERRRLWIALAVTLVAVPLLVLDNLPDDDDGDETTTSLGVVAPSEVSDERPESGPAKGISVVTSSTTSSTVPLTTTTTAVAD
jgi:hypothetical protein